MQVQEVQKIWNKLPKSCKKIFSIIHRLDEKHKGDVFFEIESVVKWSGFCERTVYYALKRLRSIGWISHLNRPYQCNIYFMLDVLKKFKFFFSRVKIAVGLQTINTLSVFSSLSVQPKSPSAPSPVLSSKENQEEQEQKEFSYPHWVPKWCRFGFMKYFNFKKFGWILRKVSEQDVAIAIENMKWYQKQGKSIEDHAKLFFWECKRRLDLKGCA